jgi:hypothetical protein
MQKAARDQSPIFVPFDRLRIHRAVGEQDLGRDGGGARRAETKPEHDEIGSQQSECGGVRALGQPASIVKDGHTSREPSSK